MRYITHEYLEKKLLSEPTFVYDCKNCGSNDHCGYTQSCIYEFSKPKPSAKQLKIINTHRLIHSLPLYDPDKTPPFKMHYGTKAIRLKHVAIVTTDCTA